MGKARVLLLNPPTTAATRGILLNLAYLAASLRKAGHQAKIIDAARPYYPVSNEAVRSQISEFAPHFVGVTLTIDRIARTYKYLQELRSLGVPIVAGGPHPNALPEEVLDKGADIVAIGEGEETIVELAEHFAAGRPLDAITGLCYKNGRREPVFTAKRTLIKNLDVLPFPDFKDFPIESYTGSPDVNSNPIFWSMLSSRGCPFDCTFCSSHNVFGRNVRLRSAGNVFNEIAGLVSDFGVDKITFQDDEILCSRHRFLELCELIIKSRMNIKISIRTRIDSIDEEILLKGKQAGLRRIAFGIESWDDQTLKNINKKYEVELIHKKMKVIESSGIAYITFNNICGFPWETRKHLLGSVRQMSRVPRNISCFISALTPVPYPKTKLYDQYHEQFKFTNWWLDPDNYLSEERQTKLPFFRHFASDILSLYTEDKFWNYSRRSKKAIRDFSWGIFKLLIKRHYNKQDYFKIIFLCGLSYRIWKASPGLESRIFCILPFSGVARLKERIVFTTKY